MRRALAAFLLAVAGAPAWGHGASKGLHLHAEPAKAPPGAPTVVSVDAAEPFVHARVGFPGEETVEIRLPKPARHVRVPLAVPAGAKPGALSVQAEVWTASGKVRRAATLVEVESAQRRDRSADEKSTASPVSPRSPEPESPKRVVR